MSCFGYLLKFLFLKQVGKITPLYLTTLSLVFGRTLLPYSCVCITKYSKSQVLKSVFKQFNNLFQRVQYDSSLIFFTLLISNLFLQNLYCE